LWRASVQPHRFEEVIVVVMVDAGLQPSEHVDGRFAPDVVDRLRRRR
jgi:hypothetical protein